MKIAKQTGFTLVELMIVVAIMGIVATVAYPSYQGMINASSRSTVQADLMSFASAMERHNMANFSYKGAATSGANTGSPSIFASYSPASESASNKKYDLVIESVDSEGLSYRLKASPVSGSSQAQDGAVYYFSDGRKAWDQNNDGTIDSNEYCWSC